MLDEERSYMSVSLSSGISESRETYGHRTLMMPACIDEDHFGAPRAGRPDDRGCGRFSRHHFDGFRGDRPAGRSGGFRGDCPAGRSGGFQCHRSGRSLDSPRGGRPGGGLFEDDRSVAHFLSDKKETEDSEHHDSVSAGANGITVKEGRDYVIINDKRIIVPDGRKDIDVRGHRVHVIIACSDLEITYQLVVSVCCPRLECNGERDDCSRTLAFTLSEGYV